MLRKKLNEMAEFRNEARAARDFVQKTLDQQQKLERQARTAPRNSYSNLADQERKLQQSLEDFQAQHPQPFKKSETESQAAQQAMNRAADSLQNKKEDARATTQQATQQLCSSSTTPCGAVPASSSLPMPTKLKQMLDKEIQTLEQYGNQ